MLQLYEETDADSSPSALGGEKVLGTIAAILNAGLFLSTHPRAMLTQMTAISQQYRHAAR